ncbi:hypothetical protein GA0074695_1521 [Micromonospora viridifaciens]|uniref:Uncharacterized protein n=1 Tax=Micromonospora viridifaciens TaxID=1881 RepID=A0A1C4VJS2_MICVI|nr:hypothetical protein GA0074695_1521 [Micromonospora viridifaciens]
MDLDDILDRLAADGDRRLAFQARHPVGVPHADSPRSISQGDDRQTQRPPKVNPAV